MLDCIVKVTLLKQTPSGHRLWAGFNPPGRAAIWAPRSVETDPTRRRAGFNPPGRAAIWAPRSVETDPTRRRAGFNPPGR